MKDRLGYLENLPVFSIVVFYGKCTFKDISFIPEGTFLIKADKVGEAIKFLFQEHSLMAYSKTDALLRILKGAVNAGSFKGIRDKHSYQLESMLGRSRILD